MVKNSIELAFLLLSCITLSISSESKEIVCYYNGKSQFKPGAGKFELKHLDEALYICSYLIYGYATIEPNTYKLLLPDEFSYFPENESTHLISDLKQRFPHLTILLSVGGGKDLEGYSVEPFQTDTKYITLLESEFHRSAFVDSVSAILQDSGFDGLDLAWQFPQTKPKDYPGYLYELFYYLKASVFGEEVIDGKSKEHAEQFTALIRELKTTVSGDGYKLTLSVLPNIYNSAYFKPKDLALHLDLVTILAFDFYHPLRTPNIADFPAPLYELPGRREYENVEFQITYWLHNAFPKNKVILGIPTYGRAWKISSGTEITQMPPVDADGPANPGIFCTEPGLLSYPDICSRLISPKRLYLPNGTKLRKVPDPSRKHGPYAFHDPEYEGEYKFWIGYDGPDSAGDKATFVKETNLGGVGLVDITLDDFCGVCGELYPILRAAASKLRT